MMNYYERIQQSIDYIEDHLRDDIELQHVASQACMSLSSLYRMFFSITGYRVKEYIRARRISEAVQALIATDCRILDIALDYMFESHEAFTRTFKQLTGQTPMACRRQRTAFRIERMNVMEMYFEQQDPQLAAEYPDIKVLKELGPMRVAFYRHISSSPEVDAIAVVREWVKKAGLDADQAKTRYFGFNNPNPPADYIPGVSEYGYEMWVTIDDDFSVTDERIGAKVVSGGKYAVMTINAKDGDSIVDSWQRLSAWLKSSPYSLGSHQWLEEHLDFGDGQGHNMKLDLYMPLR
ncbi:MAG: AraC family transcriptional regulator [Armatimonadota bacterium]